MELEILHAQVYNHTYYFYLDDMVSFISVFEAMSRFPLIMVCKSVNLFLIELMLGKQKF